MVIQGGDRGGVGVVVHAGGKRGWLYKVVIEVGWECTGLREGRLVIEGGDRGGVEVVVHAGRKRGWLYRVVIEVGWECTGLS